MNKMPIATATTLLPRYQTLLPIIRWIAYNNGYAIGVHGSGQRDFDLIAVPWADEAVSADELVERLVEAVEGVVERPPAAKPHGRRAWSIKLTGRCLFYETPYIDLSVMPAQAARPMGAVYCQDCGRAYPFGLDVVLPDDQWALIMGQPDSKDDPGRLLCANCIVLRASRLPGVVRAKLVLE